MSEKIRDMIVDKHDAEEELKRIQKLTFQSKGEQSYQKNKIAALQAEISYLQGLIEEQKTYLATQLQNTKTLIQGFEQIKSLTEKTLDVYDSVELVTSFQSTQIAKMAMAVQLQRKDVMTLLNTLDRYESQIESDLNEA